MHLRHIRSINFFLLHYKEISNNNYHYLVISVSVKRKIRIDRYIVMLSRFY